MVVTGNAIHASAYTTSVRPYAETVSCCGPTGRQDKRRVKSATLGGCKSAKHGLVGESLPAGDWHSGRDRNVRAHDSYISHASMALDLAANVLGSIVINGHMKDYIQVELSCLYKTTRASTLSGPTQSRQSK